MARALAEDPRIDVLSITDNPGGHAMLAPDTLGHRPRLARAGGSDPPLVQGLEPERAREPRLEAQLRRASTTCSRSPGTIPITGHRGLAAPVFDIDSVGLISLLAEMNERAAGYAQARAAARPHELPRRLRRDEPQAARARGDAAVLQAPEEGRGGRAVRDQPDRLERAQGRRAAALDPARGLDVSVIANVYLLSRTAARAFHAGKIPGVVVTDELLALAERYGGGEPIAAARSSSTSPRSTSRSSRGLGFDGVYMGGHMPAATIRRDPRARRHVRRRRLACASRARCSSRSRDEFYFFERDAATGLVQRRERVVPRVEAQRRTDLRVPVKYRFSRRLHTIAFADEAPSCRPAAGFYRAVERSPRRSGRSRTPSSRRRR